MSWYLSLRSHPRALKNAAETLLKSCRGAPYCLCAMLQRLGVFSLTAILALSAEKAAAESIQHEPQSQPSPPRPVLLRQCRQIQQELAMGTISKDREREAAYVLAWGQFLEELENPADPDRADYVAKNIGSSDLVAEKLTDALDAYRRGGNTFQSRRGVFLSAYISKLDGSAQLFALYVPSDYDSSRRYALEMRPRHGLSCKSLPDPGMPTDRLILYCSGRGGMINTLGEQDALAALRDVRENYSIDADRIYLRGGSIGGGAVWRLLARYPDVWAGAQIDYGWSWTERLCLENAFNIPIWVYHDTVDQAVPVDESRLAANHLSALGAPVIYTQTTGGGHSGKLKDPAWDQTGWLLRQRRNPWPRQIHYATSTAERGRAYWIEILELTNPNALATVHATTAQTPESADLYLHAVNIDVLRIGLPRALFAPDKPVLVAIDGQTIRMTAPQPDHVYLHRGQNGSWTAGRDDPRPDPQCRPYTAGGLNVMYTSPEPLMIVQGTGGDPNLVEAIDSFCRTLSCHATGWWPFPMDFFLEGRIPVKADRDVTAANIQGHNLILVGPVSANSMLARITARLPAVETRDRLKLGEEYYDMSGRGYGLLHFNPEAPSRLIMILSSNVAAFYDKPANAMMDRMSDERPVGLMLADVAPFRWVRQIHWDKGWTLPVDAMQGERLPDEFAKPDGQLARYLEAMARASGAQYSVYWREAAPGTPAWDVKCARWHDLETEIGQEITVYVGLLSGTAVAKLAQHAQLESPSIDIWPPLSQERVNPQALYRVCFDPRMSKEVTNIVGGPLQGGFPLQVDLSAEMRRVIQSSSSHGEATASDTTATSTTRTIPEGEMGR